MSLDLRLDVGLLLKTNDDANAVSQSLLKPHMQWLYSVGSMTRFL
jgi:hypothetical protein